MNMKPQISEDSEFGGRELGGFTVGIFSELSNI